jgi:hypothetical protein
MATDTGAGVSKARARSADREGSPRRDATRTRSWVALTPAAPVDGVMCLKVVADTDWAGLGDLIH